MAEISQALAAYRNSALWAMREAARAKDHPFTAIFSDLDETLYHPERRQATQDLYRICSERGWPIIVLTGNGAASIFDRSLSGQFPPPHVIVGNVSTDIWILQSEGSSTSNYLQDTHFANRLKENYRRKSIVQKSLELITHLAKESPQADFNFQHPEREEDYLNDSVDSPEPYKVSFFFDAPSLEKVESIREVLQRYFPEYRVLISHHSRHNRQFPEETPKYCADILPTTKGDTVEYLRQLLGIDQGIVAGDSGNDIEMLIDTPVELHAIMVGGSKSEAVGALEKATKRTTHIPGVRIIKTANNEEKLCYREVHSEHIGPDSIIEGLDILLANTPTDL